MVSRARDGRERRQQEIAAYLRDENVPDVERGAVMLGLITHAFTFLLLIAAQAAWGAVTAVRVWRRRDAGWPRAVRTGVHGPTLAGLVTATFGYQILVRFGRARLSSRARAHASRSAP